MPTKLKESWMRKKHKKAHNFNPLAQTQPRPSRKKRVLIGTALALGALGIAGQIEKGRDAQ